MKNLSSILFILAAVLLTSCSVKIASRTPKPATVNRLPPGQAKKVTGSQSAKPYAPGQQKH
jgi:hypothetical protein